MSRIVCILSVALYLFVPLLQGAELTPDTTYPGLKAILPHLQQGGLVLYMRHGQTDTSRGDDIAANLADCRTQRNLNEAGRQQMSDTGAAIKTLGIPIGEVYSSPFCRATESAQLAFGHFNIDNDLFYAIQASPKERQRLSKMLQVHLSTPPDTGRNTVIVAHSANLKEAIGVWPKPEGVVFVFAPQPGGSYRILARITPEEWVHVAATMAN